jgi:hypothetical protein
MASGSQERSTNGRQEHLTGDGRGPLREEFGVFERRMKR